MLSFNESLKILKETKALLEGHFILSSGLHSGEYIQCAKLLSYPKQAVSICSSLVEKINKEINVVDIILSPAVGGIVVGYEVGRQMKTQTIFAERENGILTLRRGFVIQPNSKVLIVEDVITTGKSALECLNLVNKCKAKLAGYACIIDRSDDGVLIKDKIISQVKIKISTYKENELPDKIKKIEATKPGSRSIS